MSGLEALLLLGSVHSVVLATVLFRRQRNQRANRYLAAVLGVLSLLLFDGFLRARGTLLAHPHLIGLTAWVPYTIGPLVFLYVREMTAPEPARLAPPWRHFVIPAAFVVLLAITFYPRSASYKLEIAQHAASWIVNAMEVAVLVYGVAYAGATLARLRGHRGHVQALYSNLHGVSLRWLLVIAVLNALVWIAAIVTFSIRMTSGADAGAASVIVPIGSTITVFAIGYFQLGQGEIFVGQPAIETSAIEMSAIEMSAIEMSAIEVAPVELPPVVPAAESLRSPDAERARASDAESVPARTTDSTPAPGQPAYARARLADADAAEVEARIRAAMTERRLYQRAGLTLTELADEVAATPHEISQVLSTRFQRNFYNFINEHRIEHVKAALRTSDRPVLDLALEAGFQSKSTFNSAFRKATGTTPSEFRQRPSN